MERISKQTIFYACKRLPAEAAKRDYATTVTRERTSDKYCGISAENE